MGYGEIPVAANLRAYWKLENTNDSGANGYNLTNNNTVTFTSGKFSNAANFGTTNTTKSLVYTAGNVLSSTNTGDNIYSLWFKLNDTTNTGFLGLFSIQTLFSGSTGTWNNLAFQYQIASGNLEIRAVVSRVTTNNQQSLVVGAANTTSWHNIIYEALGTNPASDILYINGQRLIMGGGAGNFSANTSPNYIVIGNARALGNQCLATVDEMFIQPTTVSIIDQYARKYYTQAKGGLVAQIS